MTGCQKGIQEEQIARETSLSRASLFKALSVDLRAICFQGLDSDLSLHLKLSASAKEIATASSPIQSVDPAPVMQSAATRKIGTQELIKTAYIPDNYIYLNNTFCPHTDRDHKNLTAVREL